MRSSAVVAVAFVAVACASSAPVATSSSGLDGAFTRAATESGVPRDLLVAVARVEGGLRMPKTRDVDADAQVPVAGPLELRRGKIDTLARGAARLGVSEAALRRDTDLALRAGALVLADLGRHDGARAGDLPSWQRALEDFSGYADARHRVDYAKRVLATLASGGSFPARDGEAILLERHFELDVPVAQIDVPERTLSNLPDYPDADVFPTDCTNKCDTNRGGYSVDRIVIHDTEGGWDASVATLQNDSGKSVHYIVGQDGRVGQFVPETYTAWHAGNYYYNQRSVGIEHVGYFHQSYPDAEYDASAKLVAYLTQKYGVPADRTHIVGHDQIPNGNVMAESAAPCEGSPSTCETGSSYGGADNHRDPGDWEWCTYMPRFGGSCKCNDIWDLWNCSSDGTQAFRCQNGQVELQQCTAGCVVEPLGQDDQCNVAEVDAGPPPVVEDAGTTPPSKHGPSAGPNGDAPQAGGCSAAPARASGAAWLALALGIVTTLRARRRR